MLQGRYSARGGQIKGRTATLMFCRNSRKNISGTIMIFRKKNFFLDLVKDWAIRISYMMLEILTVLRKTSDIIVDPLCDISPSLMQNMEFWTIVTEATPMLPPNASNNAKAELVCTSWNCKHFQLTGVNGMGLGLMCKLKAKQILDKAGVTSSQLSSDFEMIQQQHLYA
jgi:hypothetical protein